MHEGAAAGDPGFRRRDAGSSRRAALRDTRCCIVGSLLAPIETLGTTRARRSLSASLMTLESLLRCVPVLVLTALIGRLVLSLLPAGRPGYHTPRELGVTWATSHLCGLIALATHLSVLELAGLEVSRWTLFVPWLLLLAARLACLPGAMVPGHELDHEQPGWLTRTLTVVLVSVLAYGMSGHEVGPSQGESMLGAGRILLPALERLIALTGGGSGAADRAWLQAAGVAALVILCAYGLRQARRVPLGVRLLILILLVPELVMAWANNDSLQLDLALMAGAGASFGIAWLRRADRRAGLLACLSLAACALVTPAGVALAAVGLLSLTACSPMGARGRVLYYSLPAWSGFTLLSLSLERARLADLSSGGIICYAPEFGRSLSHLTWPWWVAGALLATSLLLGVVHWVRGEHQRGSAEAQVGRPEHFFLMTCLLTGFVLLSLVPYGWASARWGTIPSPTMLAPWLLLLVGSTMLPRERAGRRL